MQAISFIKDQIICHALVDECSRLGGREAPAPATSAAISSRLRCRPHTTSGFWHRCFLRTRGLCSALIVVGEPRLQYGRRWRARARGRPHFQGNGQVERSPRPQGGATAVFAGPSRRWAAAAAACRELLAASPACRSLTIRLRQAQILLVGDSGVGKSSLLLRFATGGFEELTPTIG